MKRPRTWKGWVAPVVGVLAAAAVITAANKPLEAKAASWYHNYEVTRPAYEARYGLWTKLDIPAQYRVNGIHSTLLYDGDVLIMAGSGNNQAFFNAGTFKTLLLNPRTMQEKLIHTPWDLFCAGHIELPDGNILLAGGTARYENLHPTHAGGSMTVVNTDVNSPAALPKGTIFVGPNGKEYKTAFPLTVPKAKSEISPNGAGIVVVNSQQNVWVDAVRKGKSSVIQKTARYRLQTVLTSSTAVYGVGTPMTLQKQNFQGTKDAYIFNVKESKFVKVNSMNYARWYPTLAEMGNGMVMAMSGLNDQGQMTMNTEMFNPHTKAWKVEPAHGFPTYPATFLTENGQLFFTGSNAGYGPTSNACRQPGLLNPYTGRYRFLPYPPDKQDLETSGSVLLPPAQKQTFMVLGGGGVGQSSSATARTAMIDLDAPDPHWVRGPNLARPTRYPEVELLPNDTVFESGGSRYYRGMHGSDNRDARIYNPRTNSFSVAASPITGRDYHSGGILLPNGSVLTLGGNPLFGNAQDTTAQIFNQEIDVYDPPYMFQGPRPRITSAPAVVSLKHSYMIEVPHADNIRYLRLMRPDNPTHVTDVNQRSIAIPFKRVGSDELRITLPGNPNLVPPSYYMLFAVNGKGIPSVAHWVRVP